MTIFVGKEEEKAREDEESGKEKFSKSKRNSKAEKVQLLKQFLFLYSTKPSEDQRFLALLPKKSQTRNHVPVEPPAMWIYWDSMPRHPTKSEEISTSQKRSSVTSVMVSPRPT